MSQYTGWSDLVANRVPSQWRNGGKGRALVVHYGQSVYTTSSVWLPIWTRSQTVCSTGLSLLGILVVKMWPLISMLLTVQHCGHPRHTYVA